MVKIYWLGANFGFFMQIKRSFVWYIFCKKSKRKAKNLLKCLFCYTEVKYYHLALSKGLIGYIWRVFEDFFSNFVGTSKFYLLLNQRSRDYAEFQYWSTSNYHILETNWSKETNEPILETPEYQLFKYIDSIMIWESCKNSRCPHGKPLRLSRITLNWVGWFFLKQ